jgi:hypothetical protein
MISGLGLEIEDELLDLAKILGRGDRRESGCSAQILASRSLYYSSRAFIPPTSALARLGSARVVNHALNQLESTFEKLDQQHAGAILSLQETA